MGLGNLFKLAKLTIRAFEDDKREKALAGKSEFVVQYNPETLSLRHESVFDQQQAATTTSAESSFLYSRSEVLSVKLVLDGTNVGYFGVELLRHVPTVAEQIADFLAVCYRMQGTTHEPSYLRLLWSKDVLESGFDCRLQSVDVEYTAFDRDGSPIHAELSAVFVKSLAAAKKAALEKKTSPDLTHRRTVVAGDTLPQLCREVYGSAAYYVRVAQVNELDDFRNLTPGREIVFPPFARKGRG